MVRVVRPFQYFARTGATSGVLLLVATVAALIWANSPWHATYEAIWESPVRVSVAGRFLELSLLSWINDGLMAAFFLLVGLEIKRELLVGELASIRQATLPIAAAIGGMLVPALVYVAVNPSRPEAAGWGIPMATDIAFALGVMMLLGPRIPVGLKVFLTALAIVDDMGAVAVIALFYSGSLHLVPLAIAAGCVLLLVVLNASRIRRLLPFLLVGVVLWFALHESGIHATIAGVVLALTIPVRTRINAEEFSSQARELLAEFDKAETGDLLVITSKGQQEAIHALERASEGVQAPLLRLEHGLQPLVQYGIMPLFAFANAGVRLAGADASPLAPVTLGVFLGLVIGKPLGITLFAWLAVRFRLAALPAQTTWRALHGAAWLGGIGFTMSLFIAAQAFGGPPHLFPAKVGILLGSTVAGTVGALLLRRRTR
jgi:NhaA family Na+:H+ antiporter